MTSVSRRVTTPDHETDEPRTTRTTRIRIRVAPFRRVACGPRAEGELAPRQTAAAFLWRLCLGGLLSLDRRAARGGRQGDLCCPRQSEPSTPKGGRSPNHQPQGLPIRYKCVADRM